MHLAEGKCAPVELLQTYLGKHTRASPNLCILIELSLILPVSSAGAERVFSAMNRIQDDERPSLKQRMLDDLMMISVNGPPLDMFDFTRAVLTWYQASPRREKLSPGMMAEWKKANSKTA